MPLKNCFLFPSTIDINNKELQYIEVNQDEFDGLPFHDTRLNHNKAMIRKHTIDQLNTLESTEHVSYIFHTAFCGSTFLSRLLGYTDKYHAIREPNVLMELANIKRVNDQYKNNKNQLQSLVNKCLAAFNVHENKRLLFKPTNATNNVINELLRVTANCKAIFLYVDLIDFLISILKKGEQGRSFVRNLYNICALDGSPYAFNDFRQVNTLTDLQIACVVWAMQMYEYKKHYYKENVKFVHADVFLSQPKNALIKISSFFGQEITYQNIIELENKGVFNSHSKNAEQEYTTAIRNQEKDAIKNKYAEELKSVYLWLKKAFELPKKPPENKHLFR